jgi:hypothetical protein
VTGRKNEQHIRKTHAVRAADEDVR